MHRHSQEYQRRELAWSLRQTPEWSQFLKPLLESYASAVIPPITSVDAGFKASRVQAEIDQANHLLHMVERLANEFKNTQVTTASPE